MKRETVEKIVNTAMVTMLPGLTESIESVCVDFDTAHKNGLAHSLSDIIKYQDCRYVGYKEDVIVRYFEHPFNHKYDSVDIYRTMHSKDDKKVLGYVYWGQVSLRLNQIDFTCELCQQLSTIIQQLKY